MLKKINRVDRKTINQVFKTGRFVNSQNIVFKFVINSKSPITRISFTAPKNITKSAVKRNLLRRRGYNVLSEYFKLIPKGVNGVFVFGKNSLELFGGKITETSDPLKNLNNELKTIISKLN